MATVEKSSSQLEIDFRGGERNYGSKPLSCCCIDARNEKQTWKTITWRIINCLMFLLFAIAAIYQWNDPDGHWWTIAYIIPSLLSLSVTSWIVFQEFLVWKIIVTLHMTGCLAGLIFIGAKYNRKLKESAPNIIKVEEGWELCGLLIVVSWLAIMSIVASYTDIRRLCKRHLESTRNISSPSSVVAFKESAAFEPE